MTPASPSSSAPRSTTRRHQPARPAGLRTRGVQVLQFAAASGAGLGIDFAAFLLLLGAGAAPVPAQALSGFAAVSFVYFSSVHRVFGYSGRFLLGLFAVYLVYQAASVAAAAFAVGALIGHGFAPVAAKLLILPVTFPANYLFMALLTRRRVLSTGGAAA